MSRVREAREHAATGIRFVFAGHLAWGNPEFGEGLHGDVEAWRCSRCHALIVTDFENETFAHAEQHQRHDALVDAVNDLHGIVAKHVALIDSLAVRSQSVEEALVAVSERVGQIAHGAFQPKSKKGVGSEQAQLVNDHAREQRIAALRAAIEEGATWRDSATVHEVPINEDLADALDRVEGRHASESASVVSMSPEEVDELERTLDHRAPEPTGREVPLIAEHGQAGRDDV